MVDVCKAAFSASHTVGMLGHENTGTAVLAFDVSVNNSTIAVDLIVLEDGELILLLLVLNLLGGGIGLLLVLLTGTMQTHGIIEIKFT